MGLIHFGAAVAAIIVGAVVLLSTKGTTQHRLLGTVFVILMLVLNVAALTIHEEDTFGPFHILAVLSLATIIIGIGLMLLKSHSPGVIAVHAHMLAWAYVGLLAAGMGQATVALKLGGVWVWPAILATLLIGGILIYTRIPRTLRAMFASPAEAS